MFKRFKKNSEIRCPIVLLDPHTTSPGQEKVEPALENKPNLFEHANRIYVRARRITRRRAAGII